MDKNNIVRPPTGADWVAVVDSGLGGLSVFKEVRALLPAERLFYFADTLHLPYGPRPLAEVRSFMTAIAGALIDLPAKAVVVACNTASAAALKHLRATFPRTHFVGMEPAVKPAAAKSRTGKVAVLATQATFQGELFESVVERFARGVDVIRQPCPGLAEFIENHPPDHPALDAMLTKFIAPLCEQGIDSLVLACTHYPLVKERIQAIAGSGVRIVDPSPAIAARLRVVLAENGLLNGDEGDGEALFNVTGDAESFSLTASMHLGVSVQAENHPLFWVPAASDEADIW